MFFENELNVGNNKEYKFKKISPKYADLELINTTIKVERKKGDNQNHFLQFSYCKTIKIRNLY
jgi:hypothetical protein